MTTLVTWNCNMAFREKKDRILECDPDVLVVQECEAPDASGDWTEFSDWRWVGEDEHQGLAVFTRNGVSLESPNVESLGDRFSIPVSTDGAVDVLGVWAMNDEVNHENRYIGQVYTTLQDYRGFLDSNTVVAGDFNWNVVWDESPKYPLHGDFSDTVDVLSECGLRSAYHAVTGSAFGAEDHPTFFMYKKRDRDHHIDYVFLPDSVAASGVDLSVGEYENWIDASDHVPVVVEF